MFGIDKIKEAVQSLRLADVANVEAIKSLQSHVAHIKSDILKLSGQFGEFKDNMRPVTAHRADELAVAISKCSLDMAELDRRLCALENAITIVPNRKYAAARSEVLTIDPDGVHDLADVLSEGYTAPQHSNAPRAAQQQLPLGRKRNTAVGVAERILANDVDAANLYRIAVARAYNSRLIRKALACGIIEANRNGKQLRLRVGSNGKAHPYNVFIEDYYSQNGSTERHIGCDNEADRNDFLYQLQAWQYEIGRYFKSQAFGKGN